MNVAQCEVYPLVLATSPPFHLDESIPFSKFVQLVMLKRYSTRISLSAVDRSPLELRPDNPAMPPVLSLHPVYDLSKN